MRQCQKRIDASQHQVVQSVYIGGDKFDGRSVKYGIAQSVREGTCGIRPSRQWQAAGSSDFSA
jgi:hypothetical protein